MNQEEQALADYQQTRRQLEEEVETLTRIRRQGEQLTDETYSDMQRMVQHFAENNEPMDIARQELAHLEEDFFSALDREKRKISIKEEEAEETYRKKVQDQNNQ